MSTSPSFIPVMSKWPLLNGQLQPPLHADGCSRHDTKRNNKHTGDRMDESKSRKCGNGEPYSSHLSNQRGASRGHVHSHTDIYLLCLCCWQGGRVAPLEEIPSVLVVTFLSFLIRSINKACSASSTDECFHLFVPPLKIVFDYLCSFIPHSKIRTQTFASSLHLQILFGAFLEEQRTDKAPLWSTHINGDLVQSSLVTQTPNSPPSPVLPFVTTTAVASPVANNLASPAAAQVVLPQHAGLMQPKTSQLSLDSESGVTHLNQSQLSLDSEALFSFLHAPLIATLKTESNAASPPATLVPNVISSNIKNNFVSTK